LFWRRKNSDPQPDVMGRDPAWYAAMEGDCRTLKKRLCDGLDVNHAGKDGATMLHVAAQYGHREAILLLLEHGADVDRAEKKFDNAPLWDATRSACADPANQDYDIQIIADLLKAGANPHRLNKVGKSPAIWAFGDDPRRLAVQAVYRAHGYDGVFEL
jgi:ankyrin repeat protein